MSSITKFLQACNVYFFYNLSSKLQDFSRGKENSINFKKPKTNYVNQTKMKILRKQIQHLQKTIRNGESDVISKYGTYQK